MTQYKVLTQSDKFFGGKFNPTKLEQALNVLAQEGWKVISATTGDMPFGFGGRTRQEIVIILEK